MGWTISPNNHYDIVSGGLNDRNIELRFTDNTTSSYTLRYEENGHCKEVVINRTSCTQPVGDCTTASMGTMSTDDVFNIALGCTAQNNNKSSWKPSNSGWTIVIENRLTDYYIPFNGGARIAVGKTQASSRLYWVCYRAINDGHFHYGASKDRTQDSNILIPPGYRVTFNKCWIEDDIPDDHKAVEEYRSHFQTSLLAGSRSDLKLHNEHVEQCYSANTSIDLEHKKVTFVVDSVCDWGGVEDPQHNVRYYGIKKVAGSNPARPEHYTDNFGDNGHRYIVPINIYRSVKNDWNDYDPLNPLDKDMTFTKLL